MTFSANITNISGVMLNPKDQLIDSDLIVLTFCLKANCNYEMAKFII